MNLVDISKELRAKLQNTITLHIKQLKIVWTNNYNSFIFVFVLGILAINFTYKAAQHFVHLEL